MRTLGQGRKAGLLYVLPRSPGRSAAIESAWLASSSLASAIGARLGGVDVLTPDGVLALEDLPERAVRASSQPSAARRVVQALPRTARAVLAEAMASRRARSMREVATRTIQRPYRLVMQLHHRYQDAGLRVARRIGAPFVLRAEALEVREDAAWGFRRPVWGGLVERHGEIRIMRRSDLVAAVSHVLDGQLADAGIEDARRVVIPNGVDTEVFAPGDSDRELLRAHRLEGRFVIGWVGGFRPFHGLRDVPAIAAGLRAQIPTAALCLVGTGPEREATHSRCRGFEDVVRFAGPVPHQDVPRWIRSFDVCLLLGESGDFHYSPLKLYEYLSCGRPVIAVDAGDLRGVIEDGANGLLVPPSAPQAVVEAIVRLVRDSSLGRRLAAAGRQTVERAASWDARADALLSALEDRGLLPLTTRGTRA